MPKQKQTNKHSCMSALLAMLIPCRTKQQQEQHHEEQRHMNPAASFHSDSDHVSLQRSQRQLRMQFNKDYFLGDDIAQIDAIFFTIHLVMTSIHKRLLVSQREQQRIMETAMAVFAGALLTRLFFKPTYKRIRPQLVFVTHVALTVLRAAVVHSMAAPQAVHARPSLVLENPNTAGNFLLTMLGVLGGPLRLFEMLGLQQPWMLHALVAVLFLLVHPLAAAEGARLAASNSLFYLTHGVHDMVAAVVDTALDAFTGVPTGQQQTCSSCAGVVIYSTICLYGSVVAPLYIMYVVEQAALHRWHSRRLRAAAAAALALDDAHPSSASASTSSHHRHHHRHHQQHQQHASTGRGSSDHASSSRSSRNDSHTHSSSGSRRAMHRQQPQETSYSVADADDAAGSLPCSFLGSLRVGNPVACWAIHLMVLVCLLIACWLLSNAFALLLLPRVLNSKQLALWCPNEPYAPYVIAGEVYYP